MCAILSLLPCVALPKQTVNRVRFIGAHSRNYVTENLLCLVTGSAITINNDDTFLYY